MQSQILPWVGSALFLTFLYHAGRYIYSKGDSCINDFHEDRALYYGIAFILLAIGAAAGVWK